MIDKIFMIYLFQIWEMVMKMNAEERRTEILTILKNEHSPLPGTDMARRLNVSRKITVHDIDMLRHGN